MRLSLSRWKDFPHSNISLLVGRRYTHTYIRTHAHTHTHTELMFMFLQQAVDYTSHKRDLETLSKFLDNGGVMPEEESDDGEDEDEDDDGEDGDDDSEKSEDASDESKVSICTVSLICPTVKI